MKIPQYLILGTTMAVFSLCQNQKSKQHTDSEAYKKLTIEDSALLVIFNEGNHCKKLKILDSFKEDLLPAGNQIANSMIVKIEEITKSESSRKSTHFGYLYNSPNDLENDLKRWAKILNCQ
jgi:hypothetical protein